MARLKDIAQKANVSVTTVSNVINGNHHKVSKEKLEIINNILKEENYVPNMTARSLVKNKSRIIGVIVPQTEKIGKNDLHFLENPYYGKLITGIEQELLENDYYLMIKTVQEYEDITKLLQKWNVDGAIILGIYEEQLLKEINKIDIPIVLIDSYIKDSKHINIGIDDEKGAYIATEYLIKKGHTNIGIVTGTIRKDGVVEKRYSGYFKALIENEIQFRGENVLQYSSNLEGGRQAGEYIAKNRPDISAIFCMSDLVACGVMESLSKNGIKIPEDISIVGFDNLLISELVTPKLTTINQNISIKGKTAVSTLIKRIDNNKLKENSIILPVELVERESVK